MKLYRRNGKTAAAMAAALGLASLFGTGALAGQDAIRIDMTAGSEDGWAAIAMANDDTVETGVNIRTAAGEDAAVAGYLYRGGAVYVLDRGETWIEVTSGSVTGYIRNEYLVFGEEAKGLAEAYGTYGVKASWEDVAVFSGRSGASKILQTAGDGDTFRLVTRDGDWMQVEAGSGRSAFISAEDVSVVMVVDSAIGVDETDDGSDSVFTPVDAGAKISEPAGEASAAADEGTGYEKASYEAPASREASYEPAYEELSYEEPSDQESSYQEPVYEDTSWAAAEETQTTQEEPAYTAPAPQTQVSESGSADELAAQAAALYQEYLTAQAAADAAVAQGASEQTILDTAAAATQAYSVYLKAQNLADQAAWNGASYEETTSPGSSDEPSSYEQTGTEEPSYEQPSYEEPSYEEPSYEEPSYEEPSSQNVSSSDLELLAALIYCEAGNQPYEGQVAVGAVVMNRVRSSAFPNTVSEVINQSGQFTPSYSGVLAAALANGSGAGYIGAASDAMAGVDPTGGLLYFNNHRGSGLKIGDHWFY